MSQALLDYSRKFVLEGGETERFCEDFQVMWKRERDRGALSLDEPQVSEFLSSIFCLVDLYNPDEDREGYELNDEALIEKIKRLLQM